VRWRGGSRWKLGVIELDNLDVFELLHNLRKNL
jgi:hypothetical protein